MARVPRIAGHAPRQREKPATGKPEVPPHFCPGCGKEQKAFLRYPWYFCRECLDRAEDPQGRRLVFTNQSVSGGFAWYYAGDDTRWDPKAIQVVCFIDRRRVIVGEARFGGVVAQPFPSWPGLKLPEGDRVVDLTAMTAENARARLVEIEADR